MIIVTGGAGFIGSHLLEKINNVGRDDIIIVDWLGDQGKWQNLLGSKFDSIVEPYSFLKQLSSKENNLPKIDAIFHLGACSDTTEANADYLLRNNTEYSKELAQYAFQKNIPFIYASSAATYGDGSQGYSDDSISTLKPLNAYGWSKQIFDEWILKQDLKNKWFGFKFFNVYGPNESFKKNMASKVWHGFHEATQTSKIKLFKSDRKEIKDGEQKRDFIFVGDVVDTLWNSFELLQKETKISSAILNLGTGKARSFTELAQAVFKALEIQENIDWIEMPDKLKGKYQYFTEGDMSKLRSYKSLVRDFTSLEDGVKQTVLSLK